MRRLFHRLRFEGPCQFETLRGHTAIGYAFESPNSELTVGPFNGIDGAVNLNDWGDT